MKDIKSFHESFYKNPDKIQQDIFLVKYCNGSVPKRARSRGEASKKRNLSIKYYIPTEQGIELQVCAAAFINILNITKHRLTGVMKRFQKDGIVIENRGGDHKSHLYSSRLLNVKEFIKTLAITDSHYCREKSTRQYLPAELNIHKLWKLYENQAVSNVKVSESFFRKVFLTNFNIGFGSTKTDACSKCIELTEKIKIEKDKIKKVKLISEKRLHKLRAEAFFELLREEQANLITFSFDCQKNLVLPKVPDQMAYYSRQLYCYNLGIVRGSSKANLTTDNVFLYTWVENEGLKGSNEIASALYNCLKRNEHHMKPEIDTIRLVSDGCPGQNKNYTILLMLAKWLSRAPLNIKFLQLVFPVTGHSYMPPDRIFGIIEKQLKKITTIILPEEYYEIFKNQGTIFKLGKDWEIHDWKSETGKLLKKPANQYFKISMVKRIFMRRTLKNNVRVLGESNYRSITETEHLITKPKMQVSEANPTQIPIGVLVKTLKLKDIVKLLSKHFGNNWAENEDLAFYKNMESQQNILENLNAQDKCEFVEEVFPL